VSAAAVASEIADPYAQALMGLAKDQSLADRFGEDASALLALWGNLVSLSSF
jgi:F-type H+-transporting ATPase subunit delta